MFEPRDESTSSDELERQNVILAIVFGRTPTTFLEKKAAAIARHRRIDFLLAARILKNLETVMQLYNYEEIRLYEYATKQTIREYLEKTSPRLGMKPGVDVLRLPRKSRLLALRPEPLRPLGYTLEVEELREGNLVDFERIMFGNRGANYQYYEGTSFASYLYQNLLHALDISDPETVAFSTDWRARLLRLLYDTNFNEYVAISAFYANRVTLKGRAYDTSYVPKYDVRELRPLIEPQERSANEQLMINYYYTANMKNLTYVPDQFVGIFVTFPFKDGYYVQPNGRVLYLNVAPPRLKSTRLSIDRICDASDIVAATDELARTLDRDEVVGYAVYADSLLKQGIALLILRRMTGNSARIGGHTVTLPTENDILDWTRVSCSRHRVILPPRYRSRNADLSLALVQDIADMCVNEMGALVICSAYRIPELDLNYVFANLKTDAQRYVFYTLLLQDYPSPATKTVRDELRPQFGRNVNANLDYHTKNARPYVDATVADRLDAFVEPVIRPTDMRSDLNDCPPYSCPEQYRFADSQLASLARNGDVELTATQLAAFIALCIQ